MNLNSRRDVKSDFWEGTMSDIAFLLIIFFILTALFGTRYILRLGGGGSGEVIIEESELGTLEIREDGAWCLNSAVVSPEQFREALDVKHKYRVKVHDTRPYQDFIDVLNLLHGEGVHQIEVVTEG